MVEIASEQPNNFPLQWHYDPETYNAPIPDALDLGLYYSEKMERVEVAKVSQSDRATHLYVVGATGTGKTKFLEYLIQQDIAAGQGFGVIDPHGDLIEDIKGFLACCYYYGWDEDDIAQRIVLVDPTDPQYTVTFNPLEKIPGVSVAEQVGELVSSFRKIWSDSWGSRMEDLMRNSLIALGEAEMTLCELASFLTRRSFRKVVLEKVENPTAQDYFRRFDTLTDRAQITWIEPVMNKINAFLADERMRQMFSDTKSSFNLREIMDNRKHLLIKLDKGKLKGNSDLLGSLFMAKIQMTAFSRSDIPKEKRVPFYLYIDEFQNFATDSFEVILSEARKYGLSLVMAHQSLSQIPDNLRGLILSSAGLQVYFRVNRQDASLLAKETFEYSGYEVKSEGKTRPVYWSYAEEWERKTAELQNLEPRLCYVKHKVQTGVVQLRTVPLGKSSEFLEMNEEEYLDYLNVVPFGAHYLRPRDYLLAQSKRRRMVVEEKVEESPPIPSEPETETVAPAAPVEIIEKPVVTEPVVTPVEQVIVPLEPIIVPAEQVASQMPPKSPPKVEREHRRLQHLIKQFGEQAGFLATIEQPTDDGQGRVDIGLVQDGKRIACEVCVTTSPEHELQNIRKCLDSGYDRVIACSPHRKVLNKIRELTTAKIAEPECQKVLFFEPAELIDFFEQEAANAAGRTDKVKGYKVKVNYQPLQEDEKKFKRQAVARIVLKSFQRPKKSDEPV